MNLGMMTVFPSGTTGHNCAHVKHSHPEKARPIERADPRQSMVMLYAYCGQRPPCCKINPALTDNKDPLWL